MQVAVIGNGKTGSQVVELLPKSNLSGVYDVDNPVTTMSLKRADIAIIFAPGAAVAEIIPQVLEAEIPAVWGSTGFTWPKDINQKLQAKNLKWVFAPNFSLGMQLVRRCLQILGAGQQLLREANYNITETHHVAKLDAPSGTALAWQKWLGIECDIKSIREGDVKGIHQLTITTEDETISLEHEAHNRKLFARGAVWAAQYLLQHQRLIAGLHNFADIVDKSFEELQP